MQFETESNLSIKAFYNVYNQLGYGFLEKVYQNALEQELFYRKVGFSSQTSYIVKYKNKKAGIYRPDLTAENIIIIEIKAVSDLNLNLAAAQLISYLSATKYKVGLYRHGLRDDRCFHSGFCAGSYLAINF